MIGIRKLALKFQLPLLKPTDTARVVQVAWKYHQKNKFWERDRKGGYDTKIKMSPLDMIKGGLKELKPEVIKWTDEVRQKLRADQVFDRQHNDYEILWKFEKKEDLTDWVVTVDSDHNEGYSRAKFELGVNRTAIFSGYTDNTVPKDGITKYAGYANIRSPLNLISFKRVRPHDWSRYNSMMLRVRGDGRNYMLLLAMDRYYDLQWNDQYQYPLFTRGGPYWQTEIIPFPKFLLSAKGRVQNKQENLMGQMDLIKSLGITIQDGGQGPFQLEIDYIGLHYDESLNQQDDYEMYESSASSYNN